MFIDYYQVLGIPSNSSPEEIKTAYRHMSMKWHPDKNQGHDTTGLMQDINEAYSILSNPEKRKRYDREYIRFIQERSVMSMTKNSETCHHSETTDTNESYQYNDYEVNDINVQNDMYEARAEARNMVNELLSSLREDSKAAFSGAWEGAKWYIVVGTIMTIICLLVMMCS